MILTLGHTKGGVGKSTLALNIAIERLRAGSDTLIVDGDPKQTSISKAIAIRAEAGLAPDVPCIVLDDPRSLRHQVGLQKSKYQDIVIDVGGKDSNALRAALTVTDALLLPIGAESVEIWAIDDILELVAEARGIHDFRVHALLNRAKPVGPDNADTIAVIREYPDIDLLPGAIGNRAVFSSAFGRGMSVAEYKPRNRKAVDELKGLMQSLYGN
ncbi:MAG: chromosome partitioning protein ParA [Betaproteobacteria bacterium]|nr:chromosome partitioning protein ParA [Betaproteobacteria bacterium]